MKKLIKLLFSYTFDMVSCQVTKIFDKEFLIKNLNAIGKWGKEIHIIEKTGNPLHKYA